MDSRDFPLSPETQGSILNLLFGFQTQSERYHIPSDSYFCYYRQVVEDIEAQNITKTHSDITNLVGILKRRGATRSYVETILKTQLPSEIEDLNGIMEDSVNLAIRLLLMMSTTGIFGNGLRVTLSGETKLDWKDGTIKNLVDSRIVPQKLGENIKLEKIFNARNLELIAGIQIRWTSNLVDHLRMTNNDTAVEVFHYASFLRFHRNCRVPLPGLQVNDLQNQTCSILPSAFLEETLRTLALLFPEYDRDTEMWFKKQQAKIQKRRDLPLDPLARECGQLKAEERQSCKFEYWHERLVILKQLFDEAEPSNIKQWWCDRRKRVQWYTFWVAAVVLALTVTFGLIQCVEGALQVWLALKAAN